MKPITAQELMTTRLMTVSLGMAPAVCTIESAASAGQVPDLMLSSGIYCVVITDQGQPVGVVSNTDLLKAIVEYEKQSFRMRA
tara:strand:+ start:588 stop:836 length:249 start_codon:yes stop_codon:yes gene_type:complete